MIQETPLLAEDISADKVSQVVDQIDEVLRNVDCEKKVKQKVKRVKKAWPEQLKRYEQYEQLLDGRNSYSKTDPDSTFMCMKEDHMLNGIRIIIFESVRLFVTASLFSIISNYHINKQMVLKTDIYTIAVIAFPDSLRMKE